MVAKIDGKRACLKVGQTCKRSLDKQYHRYGFHCHTGRLAKATKPKPKPSDVVSKKIDVGGFRLAITCRGTGSPTVILDSGGGQSADAWFLLERNVAKTTRVCSYDRAGLGSSDPRTPPGPVPAAKVVEELHALLGGAGLSPPYVLGGWSLGAFFNRLYVKRYPAEVVGLVSVDGGGVSLLENPRRDMCGMRSVSRAHSNAPSTTRTPPQRSLNGVPDSERRSSRGANAGELHSWRRVVGTLVVPRSKEL